MPENIFKNFDWSRKSIGKIFGIAVLGLLGLALAALLISFSIRTVISPFTPQSDRGGYLSENLIEKSQSYKNGQIQAVRYQPDGIVNENAEDYEVQEYNVIFRSHSKNKICNGILDLKSDPEIIFRSSNEGERSCSYRFNVIKERTDEILQLLEEFNPDTINSYIHTIQKTIVGMSDELEILRKKLNQTETILADAQKSYNELTILATDQSDIESLTKLIDLKLNTIDRLFKERLTVNEQIERTQKLRAEQIERLKYTDFNVSVYEEKFIDWKQISEDWKQEIRNFVDDLTDFTQVISVRLVTFILRSVVALIYIGFAFVLLKLVWLLGKKVWTLKRK